MLPRPESRQTKSALLAEGRRLEWSPSGEKEEAAGVECRDLQQSAGRCRDLQSCIQWTRLPTAGAGWTPSQFDHR